MPYIVTTKRPDVLAGQDVTFESRRAVATLEEARNEVGRGTCGLDSASYNQMARIPEQGGTVGPLPDGTVIQVERVPWRMLTDELGWNPNEPEESEILGAFNARQS